MTEVIFIVPPFVTDICPSTGLSLLKSILTRNNISSEVLYTNLIFRDSISYTLYDKMTVAYSDYLLGEYIFSSHAYPNEKEKQERYYQKYKNHHFKTSYPGVFIEMEEIVTIKEKAKEFLENISKIILEKKPRIVAFQSNFNQVCLSIALGNLLKKNDNSIVTIMGGYNCQEPMGSAIMNIASSIDFIFSGEADIELPVFCQNALKGILPAKKIITCKPNKDLNSLPYPDFSDFFKQSKDMFFSRKIRLAFESGRGCWWGEQSHCIFCGANGAAINHRQKSPERINEEINYLVEKYQLNTVYPTDNIIPRNSPIKLSDETDKLVKNVYYEVRPTAKFQDLYVLKKHKYTLCQPGIETLNDRLLSHMGKGTTALNNIRFLRDCKSLRIHPMWSFLHDIPGEETKDYLEMTKIIPLIYHLTPPSKINPIALQRYSPIFNNPEKYGISDVKPLENYYHLFPEGADFLNMAVYYKGSYNKALHDSQLNNLFFSLLNQWHESKSILHLARITSDVFLVIDTRKVTGKDKSSMENKFLLLDGNDYSIIEQLYIPVKKNRLSSFIEPKHLKNKFQSLLKLGYIIEDNDKYLTVVNESIRELEIQIDNGTPLNEDNYNDSKLLEEKFINDLNNNENLFGDFKKNPEEILKQYKIFISDEEAECIRLQLSNIFV
jgi:ribosomal peptide maturation radical SAM protein 1